TPPARAGSAWETWPARPRPPTRCAGPARDGLEETWLESSVEVFCGVPNSAFPTFSFPNSRLGTAYSETLFREPPRETEFRGERSQTEFGNEGVRGRAEFRNQQEKH